MKKILLDVQDMSCSHCAGVIEKSLKLIEGVKKCKINLKKKTVMVEYDELKTSVGDIKQTIEDKAGFSSKEI